MAEASNLKGQFDGLLSRYVSVWLWSILFGGTTALTYTLITYPSERGWAILPFLLAVLTWSGILLLALSWIYLYRYLTLMIIPIFILGRDIKTDDPKRKLGAHVLSRAFLFMIVAGFLGLSSRALQSLFYLSL